MSTSKRSRIFSSIYFAGLLYVSIAITVSALVGPVRVSDFFAYAGVLLSIVGLSSCVLVVSQILSLEQERRRAKDELAKIETLVKEAEQMRLAIAEVSEGLGEDFVELLDFLLLITPGFLDGELVRDGRDAKLQKILGRLHVMNSRIRLNASKDIEKIKSAILNLGQIGEPRDIPKLRSVVARFPQLQLHVETASKRISDRATGNGPGR